VHHGKVSRGWARRYDRIGADRDPSRISPVRDGSRGSLPHAKVRNQNSGSGATAGSRTTGSARRVSDTREKTMRSLKTVCNLLAFLCVSGIPAMAQGDAAQKSITYTPSLGDMMTTIQLRHAKLWYAVRLRNWSLADYQLQQLNASLKEISRLYPNTPTSDLTRTEKLAARIGESITARSEVQFERSFAEMTGECNACHAAAGRAFILIRKPTFPSPYSNQVFAPSRR
jgi:hypothetical protein